MGSWLALGLRCLFLSLPHKRQMVDQGEEGFRRTQMMAVLKQKGQKRLYLSCPGENQRPIRSLPDSKLRKTRANYVRGVTVTT